MIEVCNWRQLLASENYSQLVCDLNDDDDSTKYLSYIICYLVLLI